LSEPKCQTGSQTGRTPPEVYRRLIHEKRITHGAFRLWHYLRDRANKSSRCWPGQRTIARDLRCKTHTLENKGKGWIPQLVSAGYLAVQKIGQSHRLEYQILFGDGHGVLPEWATRGKAQAVSCCPNGTMATPNEATPRVAETGDVSNTNGVIQRGKEFARRERWQIEADVKSIKNQIERHKSDTGHWIDTYGLKHANEKPTPEAQAKIKLCHAELKRLEQELDEQVACGARPSEKANHE